MSSYILQSSYVQTVSGSFHSLLNTRRKWYFPLVGVFHLKPGNQTLSQVSSQLRRMGNFIRPVPTSADADMDPLMSCYWRIYSQRAGTVNHLFYGTTMLVLTLASLALNSMLTYIVFKGSVFEGLFRWHVVSLISSASTFLLSNFILLIPMALFRIYFTDPWNTILSIPHSLGYLTIVFTTTFIALDRFLFFYFRNIHLSITSNGSLLKLMLAGLPWISAILLIAHMSIYGCRCTANPLLLKFSFRCSDCGLYKSVTFYMSFVLPGITFALYCAIYANIIVMRHRFAAVGSVHGRTNAVNLVVQFSLVWAIQCASSATYYVLPKVADGSVIVGYTPMIVSTLLTMANPCVMLIFQPRIRKAVFHRKKITAVKTNEFATTF